MPLETNPLDSVRIVANPSGDKPLRLTPFRSVVYPMKSAGYNRGNVLWPGPRGRAPPVGRQRHVRALENKTCLGVTSSSSLKIGVSKLTSRDLSKLRSVLSRHRRLRTGAGSIPFWPRLSDTPASSATGMTFLMNYAKLVYFAPI